MMRKLYLLTLGICSLPLWAILYLSLVANWAYPNLGGWTWHHWQSLFGQSSELLISLGLSLILSVTIASGATVFGFFMSKFLLLDECKPRWVQFAFYPYLITPVVFGAMLQFYFVRMGLTGRFWGVFLAQVLFVFPYAVLLLSTFWNERIRQIAFQAKTLGASERQLLRTVLLPMARPWLLICLAQCFLISWFEYGITQLIGVGKVKTLTIQTMQFVKEANPHLAALAACLMILPLLGLGLLLQRR